MIYTRIEWIWTDEGLEETFVESCEYEGEFVMCGGGDSGSDSGGDDDGDDGGGGFQDYRDYTPPPPPPPPKPSEPKVKASTSSTEEKKAGFGYSPETGFTYNTTPERSEAASKAMQYAVIHGTLKGSGYEDDQFLLNTTSNLRTNDPDYLGDDSSSSGSATTTTARTTPTGDDDTSTDDSDAEEPLSTFVDDEALRKTRRRLRDRFGRRATRGGGAETVGTGYTLGS